MVNKQTWLSAIWILSLIPGQLSSQTLPSSAPTSASAPVTQPTPALVQAFASWLSGGITATQFEAAARREPRVFTNELIDLISKTTPGSLGLAAQQETLAGALSLLLQDKPIEAQSEFLSAMISLPKGDSRAFVYALSSIAGKQASAEEAAPPTEENKPKNEGAGVLIFDTSLLGLGAGALITIDHLESTDRLGAASALMLGLGIAGGFGGHAYIKAYHKDDYSYRRSLPVTTGILLGLGQNLFLLDTLGGLDEKTAAKLIYTTGLFGAAAGLAIGERREPSREDHFLALSSTLWGTAFGVGVLVARLKDDPQRLYLPAQIGYNAGIAAGLLAATKLELSIPETALLNACGGLGALAGALVTLPFEEKLDPTTDAGAALVVAVDMVGVITGFGVGAWIIKNKLRGHNH